MINKNLPTNPGCYIFRNSNKKVIYIGKAKNIKKRVTSYFTKTHSDSKTQVLVENIVHIDFISTNTEVEALLLENTLIKQYKPKYNIDLKDSKRYAYLEITKEEFPRLLLTRTKSNGELFGPFTSGYDRKYVRELLIKTFKIRTCKKLPKKACLKFHINLCDAPCINNISKVEYDSQINKVRMVLKGKTSELINQLKHDMKIHSKNQNFEKGIEIRNQISALEYLKEKQSVQRIKKYNEDIIDYIIKDQKVYLMLFKIYKGTLVNKEEFVFDYYENFFDSFITQYYDDHKIPKELILRNKLDPVIHNYLEQKRKTKVKITIPKIGEKNTLLKLVKKNIELTFFGDIKKVEELKKSLDLKFMPSVIECFDISHLGGKQTTGSMVQFRNGQPDKSNYRRFKIKSYIGNDEFAGISEVVVRRYKRLKEENKQFPDLIIIDGGKGQLSAAIKSLKKLEISIPIISVAKREEEIFAPGLSYPLILKPKNKGLLFIRQIRDEAHRFAIKYNKLLRKKEIKSS